MSTSGQVAHIAAVKRIALQRFRTIGNVVGVGITRVAGDYAIKVNLSEPVDPGTELPTEIDGVRVRVEVMSRATHGEGKLAHS